jgi:hypothetical protein
MIQIEDLFFFLLITFSGFALNRIVKKKYPNISLGILDALFIYHILFAVLYYTYAQYYSSDSHAYFSKVFNNARGEEWSNYFKTGTPFIEFVGWPFIKVIDLGYESLMLLFSFFGYIGVMFFYLFFKENIRFKHNWLGTTLLPFVLFLPNMHFWTVSFGKGSLIFMGIGAFFYGISRPHRRWWLAALAIPIIYFVRPHMAFIFLAGVGLSLLTGAKDLKLQYKIPLFLSCFILLFFVYQNVFQYVGMDLDEDLLEEGTMVTSKLANKLSTKANSGVDISNYNIIQKIGVFVFMPLFFNANGVFGFFVSFENLFYVLIACQIFRGGFVKYILNSDFITKTSLICFVGSTIALAQISGNLGIAVRMKSMIMFLFLFVILKFMDYKEWKIRWIKWKRYSRQIHLKETAAETVSI